MIPKSALLPILVLKPQLTYIIAEVITERQHLLNLNQVHVSARGSQSVKAKQKES